MLNLAICDDELEYAKIFAKLLEKSFLLKDFKINLIAITSSQDEIYKLIIKNKIDLLFLDIDFKNSDVNGIEFSKKIRKINKSFYLVFLTAHSRYMPVSFLSKTFDYLTKPINVQTIDDLTQRFLDEYLNNTNNFIKINNKLRIKTDSILYIEKNVNKCEFITTSSTYSCITTLSNLSDKLPSNFVRGHISYIINKDKILSIDKVNKCVIMCNSDKVPFSNSLFSKKEF